MSAEPRFATARVAERNTYALEVAGVAEELGFELRPWQLQVLDTALEFRADGTPWHKEGVTVTVSRQNGKTVMVWALMTWWCRKWPNQKVIYVAQTRLDAANRVLDLGLRLMPAGDVRRYKGVGSEHLQFDNGSRIDIIAPNAVAAHGSSVDLAVCDESWTLQEVVLAGLIPSQAARPGSMLWFVSTQGDEDSEVMNRLTERGRLSVDDPESKIAYFEWSADEDAGDDVSNPDHWGRWMPMLGDTVSVDSIKAAQTVLSPSAFRRAFGNVQTTSREELWPEEWWPATEDRYIHATSGVVLAFDVNASPAGASIVAAFPNGEKWHVDLVEYQAGESSLWLIKRLRELVMKHRPLAVASAGGGPSRAIMPEIKALCANRGITFRQLTAQDMGAAAGLFHDSLRTKTLTHGESGALSDAVRGARGKAAGDMWKFDRVGMRADASPLIAASLALYVAQEAAAQKVEAGVWFPGA